MASPGEWSLHIVIVLTALLAWALVLHVVAGVARQHSKQQGHRASCASALIPCPQRRQLQSGLRLHGCDFAGYPGVRA